jgi:hypothetical protein
VRLAQAKRDVAKPAVHIPHVVKKNTTKIAATPLVVQTATATSLQTGTPTTSGSGHISVQTPFGTAVSTADFFFVPAPYATGNVALASRVTAGVPVTAKFSANKTLAILLYEGTAGQKARLLANNASQNHLVSVVNPDGSILMSDTDLGAYGGNVLDTPVFGTNGTYAIYLKADPTWQGAVSLTVANPAASGDFSLSAVTEFYQNIWLGPAFEVFINHGGGLANNVQLTASGLPACATAAFSPSSFSSSGSARLTFTLTNYYKEQFHSASCAPCARPPIR